MATEYRQPHDTASAIWPMKWLVPLLIVLSTSLLPADEPAVDPYADGRQHWSLQPITRPQAPQFAEATTRAWVRNPIDAFILARLRKAGLADDRGASSEADPRTLIRRVTFDLTGLPPTVEEVEEFAARNSPSLRPSLSPSMAEDRGTERWRDRENTYEALIDRLLASPHYGERWGQRWLDVVRFAETEGFEYDNALPDAWRYRDYVIRSFNDDKPFDRFVLEQLAGDEIDPNDHELLTAAGFNRLGPVRRNAGNQLVAGSRNEVLTEMTNVVGAAFLGLTIGCARCHDHKFDPILQRDYYRLEAFFAATHQYDVRLAAPGELAAWEATTKAVQAELKQIKDAIEKGEALESQLAAVERRLPPSLPSIASVRNDRRQATRIHVLKRGEWEQPLEPVGMRTLGVLLPAEAPELAPDAAAPRSELAHWLTARDNPLTARVLVNRLWQGHFGTGLVATPNDFGAYGAEPSHPELLDWLACELVDGGWRLKRLHRLIVTSATYRQSSIADSNPQSGIRNPQSIDPANRLLWRANRRRLEAETLRDAMLAVAGRLNLKAGGPSVITPVDRDLVDLLYKPAQWQVTPDRREHDRRSIYLLAKRNLRLPFMEAFDQPDMLISCGRRESSTHALQALELLNGRLANELAEALAARLAREAGNKTSRQVDLAYRLATGREPSARERELAIEFLRTQSLREFALAVLNLNAFVYVE